MPAKRGKNFRSGDIAEQLGLYLIQSVALGAPVPRTEDVGIDVVCTLISNYNQYSYLAEDSFYVQIKSTSVKEIEYKGVEVEWLRKLKLPFFVAVVDKMEAKISIYTCKRLYDAFALNKDREVVKLVLDSEEKCKQFDFVDKDEEKIYLGIPIIEWSINDLMNNEEEIKEKVFVIIKEHIRIVHKAMELYDIGWGMTYGWKTNEMPYMIGEKASSILNITEDELYGRMMNYLIKSLEYSLINNDFGMIDEAEAVIKEFREVYNKFSVKKEDDRYGRT